MYFTPVSGVSACHCSVSYDLSITLRCSAIDATYRLACSGCKDTDLPGMETEMDGRNPGQTQARPFMDNLVVTGLTHT